MFTEVSLNCLSQKLKCSLYPLLSPLYTSEKAKMDKMLLNILLTIYRNKEIVSKDSCEGCRYERGQLFFEVQLSLCVPNCIWPFPDKESLLDSTPSSQNDLKFKPWQQGTVHLSEQTTALCCLQAFSCHGNWKAKKKKKVRKNSRATP